MCRRRVPKSALRPIPEQSLSFRPTMAARPLHNNRSHACDDEGFAAIVAPNLACAGALLEIASWD